MSAHPLSTHPLLGPLILAGVLIAIVLIALSARSILRTVTRPLRRVVRSTATEARSNVRAAGTVPYTAMAQVIGFKSLAEAMLGEVPQTVRKMVQRQGWIFRSANANQAVDQLAGSLSLDDAKRNLDAAKHYYEEPMGANVSPVFLYEDSEEALIIRILKDVDLVFFYVTRRINRNISRNVLKIIAILTALMLIFPFVAAAAVWLAHVPATTGYAITGGLLAAFVAAMALLKFFYTVATRNNGQYFNHFVQTYFGRLLNQYKSAAGAFAGVLNDHTSDLKTIEQDADTWFLNLHWLAARQWFLDLYVRNMIFQVARNLWLFYLTPIAYCFLAVVAGVVLYVVGFNPFFWAHDWTALGVFVPWALLFVFYLWALTGLLSAFWHEITSAGWLGFQTMDIKSLIDNSIGPIVRELVDRRRDPMGRHGSPN
jgi:ABC-type multidrug transport system fused ATPase/permease subunit